MKPYKGFIPVWYFCQRTKVYVGHVSNAQDLIAFSAVNEASLYEAFIISVDNYLAIYHLLNPISRVELEPAV